MARRKGSPLPLASKVLDIDVYVIREIKLNDLEQVYSLLLDLIKHEKLEDVFKYSFEKVREDLFGNNADWHCLVIDANGKIVGFCFYSFANINRIFNYSPLIQIDDIYVHPNYRRHSMGKKLLREVALIGDKRGIKRIELWCMKDNEVGQSFYKKLNARFVDTIDVIRLNVEELLNRED